MTRSATLRDGRHVNLRPIEPGDRRALVSAFERLSDESRYRRFFAAVPRLSERQLDYLTEVDHHDHEALIAFDEDTGDAVGVARFVRVEEDVAEPAVAVVDDWQGRGLASLLLDALVERAREEDVGWFVAPVLAGNQPAIAALRRLGPSTVTPNGREVELRIALPARDGATPALRELLRAAAADTVRPVTTVWQRFAAGVRARRPTMSRNTIVVAVPAGPDGDLAVRVAADLARVLGAGVHLVGVQRLLLDVAEPLEEALRETAGDLGEQGIDVTSELRRGDLAAAVLDAAGRQQARLIVVDGNASDADERLLGSAWDHVAHHAPCDVLVAR